MKPLLLSCAVLAIPASASAQLAELAPDYGHVHRATLDNGLEVVVVEAPALPIVTIEMAARNGAFTETPELNGLSHLYEHMFFKANASIPSQEAYMARQRELGMVWNGTTSEERVNYFFTLPAQNLADGLQFMADAIRTPLFVEDELVREREVVIGEFDRNEANPGYHLGYAIDQALWWQFPTRKDALGDRHSILSATVEQMQWMQQTYYVPNNALLVLSGDVTFERGVELAEQMLGDWERGPDPFEAYPIPEHPPLPETTAVVVDQPIQVSVVSFTWHGPDTRRDVDATYAADVFSFILSQSTSQMQQALVDSGLALQAYVSYSTLRYTGPISFTAVTLPGREADLIAAMRAEIDRFDDPEYYSDEQIATAQRQLAIADLYTQQSTSDFAHTLTYWWASASLDYYLGYIGSLAEVTRDDMTRYVQTYIQDQPFVAAIMADGEALAQNAIDTAWLHARVTEPTGESDEN